jgi:hypothetical protein
LRLICVQRFVLTTSESLTIISAWSWVVWWTPVENYLLYILEKIVLSLPCEFLFLLFIKSSHLLTNDKYDMKKRNLNCSTSKKFHWSSRHMINLPLEAIESGK